MSGQSHTKQIFSHIELSDDVVQNLKKLSYVNVLNCREQLYDSALKAFDYIKDIFTVIHKQLKESEANQKNVQLFCNKHYIIKNNQNFTRFQHWRDDYTLKKIGQWKDDWRILAGFYSNEEGSNRLSKLTSPDPASIGYILTNCDLFSNDLVNHGRKIIWFRNEYYGHLGELHMMDKIDLKKCFSPLDSHLIDLNKITEKEKNLAASKELVKSFLLGNTIRTS